MKKENEKMKKINADKTKNVSGGKLIPKDDPENPGKVLYDVTDNSTGNIVAENLNRNEALRIDKLYNQRNQIEQRAAVHAKSTKKSGKFDPWD